ncbi:hypothetical protein C2G38_1376680 [Gigaspora rosea]|uniref:Uncharacterized protein n=1 Tax=Gigaspora rosea TaxID=44941 RepID=A0A397V673_9GLOM|nr:hypothetical protein C2G38_1376680 [Gigaspora rosea]
MLLKYYFLLVIALIFISTTDAGPLPYPQKAPTTPSGTGWNRIGTDILARVKVRICTSMARVGSDSVDCAGPCARAN